MIKGHAQKSLAKLHSLVKLSRVDTCPQTEGTVVKEGNDGKLYKVASIMVNV